MLPAKLDVVATAANTALQYKIIGRDSGNLLFVNPSRTALPMIRTAEQWAAFDNSITSATAARGDFGPNKPIEWRRAPDAQLSQDDEFYGTSRRDNHVGGAGDDYFGSSAGNDTFSGGSGQDQASYDRDPGAVKVDLATGVGRDGFGGTDQLLGIEDLRGSGFADQLRGNAGANAFRGLEGNDTIDGRDGIDLLRYDRDENYGGTRGVTVQLGQNSATDGFGDSDTIYNIENVWGSRFDDLLDGNRAANALDGLAGNDQLHSLGGNDRLDGGNGDDTLDGGSGNDRLLGGRGADTFVFSGRFGKDRILDFDSADRIDLRAVAAITSLGDLFDNHMTQSGENTVIRVNSSTSITVLGVDLAELTGDNFLF